MKKKLGPLLNPPPGYTVIDEGAGMFTLSPTRKYCAFVEETVLPNYPDTAPTLYDPENISQEAFGIILANISAEKKSMRRVVRGLLLHFMHAYSVPFKKALKMAENVLSYEASKAATRYEIAPFIDALSYYSQKGL